MPDDNEKIRIIVNDESFFCCEDGEIFYNLGKDKDKAAEICRQVLQALKTVKT